MRSWLFSYPAIISLLLLVFGCTPDDSLTVYSGRSKALVEDLVKDFEEESGINVNVRYGSSTQLSMALMEEGDRSPADLFWSQDAGALGAIHRADRFEQLPEDLLGKLPEEFQSRDGTWVATSGRARVLAYSKSRVDENDLPASVYDLTDEKWQGRVGWAPSNASFQSFLTAMRASQGESETRQWVLGMESNDAQVYSNNNALIQAISAGEIDLAITNHYYLFRYLESDEDYPVDQTFFEEGDPGNLINVSGIGILNHSENKEAARQFAAFLLDEKAQKWFAEQNFEYPVIQGLELTPDGTSLEDIRQVNPELDLNDLEDLDATLQLLREVGLL